MLGDNLDAPWGYYEPYESDSEVDEWEDKNHDVKLIHDLDTNHIKHIIQGLNSGKSYWEQGHKLRRLEIELERRK